jgi:hypothetical protein
MTKKAFINLLTELAEETVDFDSNDVWGFGGARGTRYIIDDREEDKMIVTVAVARSRHQGPYGFITLRLHRIEAHTVTLVDVYDTPATRERILRIVNKRKS